VVTANGENRNGLRSLRKDNSGHDLRNIPVGSEGTPGIITATVPKLHPRPRTRIVARMALASVQTKTTPSIKASERIGTSLWAFALFQECRAVTAGYDEDAERVASMVRSSAVKAWG